MCELHKVGTWEIIIVILNIGWVCSDHDAMMKPLRNWSNTHIAPQSARSSLAASFRCAFSLTVLAVVWWCATTLALAPLPADDGECALYLSGPGRTSAYDYTLNLLRGNFFSNVTIGGSARALAARALSLCHRSAPVTAHYVSRRRDRGGCVSRDGSQT
ncbi:hypothetical protein EVAR_99042_1 [Eumeta japonica]|uniref:Uncharacterized protein n=1 Tax=Eumeta variegata TaxID=151549 RepID=A0A4C1XXP7_EUMVA|nr:hypothetical protein EVAR_99042_1 [Eumeta japonica]